MYRKPAKRSSFFLLELIIAILFFSLASAVCVRFFIKSHTMSQNTRELNMSINEVSGCAELFLAMEDFPSHSSKYMDDGWNICNKKNAVYILQSTVQDDGAYQDGTFAVIKAQDDTEIYRLDVRRYIADRQEVAR